MVELSTHQLQMRAGNYVIESRFVTWPRSIFLTTSVTHLWLLPATTGDLPVVEESVTNERATA